MRVIGRVGLYSVFFHVLFETMTHFIIYCNRPKEVESVKKAGQASFTRTITLEETPTFPWRTVTFPGIAGCLALNFAIIGSFLFAVPKKKSHALRQPALSLSNRRKKSDVPNK